MKVDEILNRLEGVKPTGKGRWVARCPAHDDKSPSLSVGQADDGRVLLHCFAGCGASAVVEAIGLSMSDLFEKPLGHRLKPIVTRSRPRAWHESMVAIGVSAIRNGEKVTQDELHKIKASRAWLLNHPITEDWQI